MYLRLIAAVLMAASATVSSREPCPSPPVTYVVVGDNVTLCWKIPSEANTTKLRRFTVLALERPVELDMEKVASAHKDGRFFRAFTRNHDGVYKGKVTVDADLQAGILYLRILNYTSGMENLYCVLYEMSVINDLRTCHSQALLLRTTDFIPTENYTSNVTTNSTVAPQATKGRVDARGGVSYRVELIIVSCILGVLLVAIVSMVVCCKRNVGHRNSTGLKNERVA